MSDYNEDRGVFIKVKCAGVGANVMIRVRDISAIEEFPTTNRTFLHLVSGRGFDVVESYAEFTERLRKAFE